MPYLFERINIFSKCTRIVLVNQTFSYFTKQYEAEWVIYSYCRISVSLFYYSKIYPTRCNVTQFILSGKCSTCFGWYHHSSSRPQTTVSTASGICHTVTANCRYSGDFNFVPSYSMVETMFGMSGILVNETSCNIMFGMSGLLVNETTYNITFGMSGLLVVSIFDGGCLIWLICPTPSVICLPYDLRFLTLFVVLLGS